MGRSDLFLKLEIAKKVVGMILLLVTMKISVMAMAYSISSQIINSYPNWKLLGYSYLEQLRDILPSILLAIAMGGCVSLVSFLPLGTLAILLLQILLGERSILQGPPYSNWSPLNICCRQFTGSEGMHHKHKIIFI